MPNFQPFSSNKAHFHVETRLFESKNDPKPNQNLNFEFFLTYQDNILDFLYQ